MRPTVGGKPCSGCTLNSVGKGLNNVEEPQINTNRILLVDGVVDTGILESVGESGKHRVALLGH